MIALVQSTQHTVLMCSRLPSTLKNQFKASRLPCAQCTTRALVHVQYPSRHRGRGAIFPQHNWKKLSIAITTQGSSKHASIGEMWSMIWLCLCCIKMWITRKNGTEALRQNTSSESFSNKKASTKIKRCLKNLKSTYRKKGCLSASKSSNYAISPIFLWGT